MLEITRIRTEKESIIEGLKKRNIDATQTLDQILTADQNWRNSKTELESISAELNQLAKEIGDLFKQGKHEEANKVKDKTASLKTVESALKSKVEEYEREITLLL
ncbi:MAG: serine--tRNA ligase, partial [Flavobacteriia bacterium]